MDKYYIQVAERHYPNLDQVIPLSGCFRTREDAIENAIDVCRAEKTEYFNLTHMDSTEPGIILSPDGTHAGVVISAKDCLSEWWYAVKVIEVGFDF